VVNKMSTKQNMKKTIVPILVIIVIIAAIGAYYTWSSSPTTSTVTQTEGTTMIQTQTQTVVETKIEGKIIQKGSDTLLIVAQRWAEDFMNKPEYKDVQISVSGGGSGTGIAALINGEIDLADASRGIKQKEIDQAKERGINPEEWKVGLDGISVIVHPDNPLTELTLAQLEAIYTGEAKDWSELGGTAGKVITYGRQSNSGTYVFFQENVLQKRDYRADMQSLNGNADIVEAVVRDEKGIGYVGLAYAEQREGEVKIIKVKKDDSSAAITPSLETIADGSYPIARFVYIYTNGIPKGATSAYLKYIISEEGQAIAEEVGFIPLTDEMQEQQLSKLE
jgi:phosphate transport system substrate-binding protein